MASSGSPTYTLLMNSDFECDDWELNEAWGLIEQTPSRESSPNSKSPLQDSQHQILGAIELDHLYHRKDSEDSMECQPESLDTPMPATPESSDPEPMDDLDREPDGERYEHKSNNECTIEDPDTANDHVGNHVDSVSRTGFVHSLHMDSDPEEPSNDWHECNSGKNPEGSDSEEGGTRFSMQDNMSDDCSVILDESENSLKYQQTKESEKVQDRMVVQVDHSYSRGSALCEICGSFFVDQFSLEKHSTEHSIHEISDISSPYQEYHCPFCDYIALSKTSFRDHQNLHIGSDLSCVWCGISFNHQEQLEHHKCSFKYVSNLKSVPENQQATCEQNVENITQEAESIMHRGRKMLGESQQRQSKDGMDQECKPQVDNCTYDDQNLHADTLKQEQSSMVLDPYAGPQPYLCEHCGSSFIQKYAFNVHMVVHRYKDSLPCGLLLEQKSINKVDPIKPRQSVFKCKMCKQKFNSNAKLQRHKRFHRADRGCLPTVPKYQSDGTFDSTESSGIMSLNEQEGSIGQQELGWELTMYGIDGKPMISRKGKSPKEGPSTAPTCRWAIKSPFDVCNCSLCTKKGLTPLGLKIHIKKMHRFSCNWCNVQAFSSEEELKNHLISHGVKPVGLEGSHGVQPVGLEGSRGVQPVGLEGSHGVQPVGLQGSHGVQPVGLQGSHGVQPVGLEEKGPNLPSVTNPESSPGKEIESVEGEPAEGSNKKVECANSNERDIESFLLETGDLNHELVQSEQTDVRAVRECSPTKKFQSPEGEPLWIKSSVAKELKPIERKESIEINGNCSTIEPSHQQNGETNVIAQARTVRDKRFKCDVCGKSYERLFMLSWHIKSHPPPTVESRPPPTLESRKTRRKNTKSLSKAKDPLPKQQSDVRATVRKINTVVDTRFHCNLCGDQFYSDPVSLKRHIRIIHSGYYCDRCNVLGFSSREQYKTHLRLKHYIKLDSVSPKPPAPGVKTLSTKEPKSAKNEEGNKLPTDKEPAKSVQSSISKESTKSVIKKELKTAKRGKKRKTSRQAARSKKSMSTKDLKSSGQTNADAQANNINAVKEKHFNCELCDKDFSSSYRLRKHMEKEHAVLAKSTAIKVVTEKCLHCDLCEKDFSRPQGLKRHIEEKHAEKRFHCDVCNKDFTRSESLKIHIQKTHNNKFERDKCVHCDVCDKDFSNPQNLKRHMEEKHAEKCVYCDLCDRDFSSSNRLKKHMEAKHAASAKSSAIKVVIKKRVHCDVCDTDFSCPQNLKKHMKTHTAIAQYSAVNSVKDKRVYCDECDRDFSRPQDLKRHMEEKHAPPSKFFCDKCDRTSFSSSAELKVHIKHHSNLVSFTCDVCSFAFGSQKSLDKHKTMYHL